MCQGEYGVALPWRPVRVNPGRNMAAGEIVLYIWVPNNLENSRCRSHWYFVVLFTPWHAGGVHVDFSGGFANDCDRVASVRACLCAALQSTNSTLHPTSFCFLTWYCFCVARPSLVPVAAMSLRKKLGVTMFFKLEANAFLDRGNSLKTFLVM